MKKFRSLQTAFSSHTFCFICKRSSSNNRLYRVKIDSIIDGFLNHRIFIKKHARSCKRHLDDSGLIKKDEFYKIPTKLKNHDAQTVLLLEALSFKYRPINLGMFDHFCDLNELSEEHCLKVTGWTKRQFIKFCSFITSLNETAGRTKEQLIALYRYWLRKGLDQFTLSVLFGCAKTQSQISKYLDQVRKAIYKDFVPFFLGAKSRTREFFLQHNNLMASELYDIPNDCLVIVVDGTYCRLEKSINNQFQYNCWSEQKMDLLIKPFGICCADGYFIDCYGPFKANLNDADIFDYILKTDIDLKSILLAEKTLALLDRGFRNLFKKLIEEYKFLARIPTCDQIEKDKEIDDGEKKKKKLSVIQTTESRMVTKCRFIIENKFGDLKNKQALDNIRNTSAGHIQIDYRIACAMSNFVHKPVCPDGENAANIALKIKEKIVIKENKLESLLTKHLDTKKNQEIDISAINDFPKLSKEQLIENVFFGTFQIKLCVSYLEDLLKNGKAYYIDENLRKRKQIFTYDKHLSNSKIVAVEIPSRHKRSIFKNKNTTKENSSQKQSKNYIKKFRTIYKVFIHYITNENEASSIINYICNCKSGHKIAGCCVHVASLIYYLSYAKYSEIKLPANHLNSIFIDIDKMELPNNPKHVRNRRNPKRIQTDLDFVSPSCSTIKKKEESNKIISSKIQANNFDIPKKDFFKKSHGKTYENKNYSSEKKLIINQTSLITNQNDTDQIRPFTPMSEFITHIPAWGGNIHYKGKKVMLTNTCTIDYYLFALWYIWKINPSFLDNDKSEKSKIIDEIIISINELNWNKAKELWLVNIVQYNQSVLNNTLSIFGSEQRFFVNYLFENQSHKVVQRCNQSCTRDGNFVIQKNTDIIFFKKYQDKVTTYSCLTKMCTDCQTKIVTEIVFLKNPTFLFFVSLGNIFIDDLPKIVSINNCNFRFLCSTVNISQHFIGIFENANNLYVVDDLENSVSLLNGNQKYKNKNNNVRKAPTTVSFYYLI